LADPHRDACPGRELLRREFPRVLPLAQDLGPVRESAHLTEDAISDGAAHLGEETRLRGVEPTADQLGGFFRAGQGTGKDEREWSGFLRQTLRHPPARGRERALLIAAIGPLRVTADLEDRHDRRLRGKGRRAASRPTSPAVGGLWRRA